jgi:glycosyltransferase involved in cell wall biosynthesis
MNQPTETVLAAQRLRVAIVTETFPPEVNGVARTVGLMAQALRGRGHDVRLIRPRQKSDAPAENAGERLVRGFALPGYPHLQIGIASRGSLVRAWREWTPDVVHVVTEGPLGWAAVSAAKRLGVPVTTDFHTNFHTYSRHYGFGWLAGGVAHYLRALHNRAACTMVPTAELKAGLEKMKFERVLVVGRGVDTKLFHPGCRNDLLRAQWGCGRDDIVALHVGRLAPEKNLRLFIEAARQMQTTEPSVRVVLVGDGPQGEELRRHNPDFHFAGMRIGEDLAAHYASADLFLFPSTTETFGNVTLEAMASGLAVVTYDYAAARQYIRHGVSGLVAPLDDAREFVRLASLPLEDRSFLASLKAKARTSAEAISWECAFSDLQCTLECVVDSARRSGIRAERLPVHDLP